MAILAFQKPDNVLMLESDNFYGKFEFRPLEPGYGITIGNALRRILLSSLEGYAFSTVKIEGINHEFASIPGVLEDVQHIILNLKQVRFKCIAEIEEIPKVNVTVSGTEVFKASHIAKQLNGFEILNPNLEICHLISKSASFTMELTISKGRGYVPAEENAVFTVKTEPAKNTDAAKNAEPPKNTEPVKTDVQIIAIDSIYTPIRNVKYSVENFRVEQKTDYEKLILEVLTDGSILPKDALKEAARILIYHFMLFSDEKIEVETVDIEENEEFDEDILHMRQLLKSKLAEMNLSVRALNCLKAADVETVGELVAFNKNDLLKFRNFGKKSLTELEGLLLNLNLSFGMDISRYKLEKELIKQ